MTKYNIDDRVKIKKGAKGMRQASERKKIIGQKGIIRGMYKENNKIVYIVQIGAGGWLEHFRTDALSKK